MLDPYSLLHYSAGLATGLGGVAPIKAIVGAALADLAFSYLYQRPTGLFRKTEVEPPINKVADIALFALGNYMGRRWSEQG
jgi:hypothetical protein